MHPVTPNKQASETRSSSPVLEVRNLRKAYGVAAPHLAIDCVSFSVREGSRLSVVGPSGAGKTTLLKCVSGLQSPTSGSVTFRGDNVEAPPDGLAIVFQDYSRSLFPWMSVEKNVGLPLRYRPLSRQRRTEIVASALESVGLSDHARRYPSELSGGMQQRVAIARALGYQPRLLLMDEPFASVDAQTRLSLEDLTLRLCKRYDITLMLITHDIDEAIYMGDQVLVLSASPAIVRAAIDVDLPGDRDQIETKLLRRFGEIRGEIYGLLHDGAKRRETAK